MDLKRDRCLAAISWYMVSTASVLDISRYSLYMLWVPEREFLTFNGRFSEICLSLDTNLPTDLYKATHHVDADNLSIGLLDLSQLHQEVPETGLCNNGVGRKYSHSVKLGRWVCLSWQMAANDLVFCKTTCE